MYFKFAVLIAVLLQVGISTNVKRSISGIVEETAFGQEHKDDNLFGIFGGRNVTINKAKYVGSLLYSGSYLIGTAVILNNRWIVTAAYNFYGLNETDVTVRVGSTYSDKQGTTVGVQKIITHPKYEGYWDYDIALAKLEKSIKFSGVFGKTTLASSLPKDGASATVSGFGWTETSSGGFLQQTTLPVVTYESCKSHYESLIPFSELSFCTSKDGAGPCAADFGSPLIYKNKLIGIFSGTFACGSTDYPAVYADVTQYVKWIKDTIKKNSGDLVEEDNDVDYD